MPYRFAWPGLSRVIVPDTLGPPEIENRGDSE